MEQRPHQSKFDGWMWTTLAVALLCFAIAAMLFNAVGGRALCGVSILIGFPAALSFLLRWSYKKK